jgi:hypothetical protein
MFTKLKDLLPKTINKHGLRKEMKALDVINKYKRYCTELLGEEALQNLVPRFYKNKKLYIDASNSSWAQYLHLNQVEILEAINKNLDEKVKGFSINIS